MVDWSMAGGIGVGWEGGFRVFWLGSHTGSGMEDGVRPRALERLTGHRSTSGGGTGVRSELMPLGWSVAAGSTTCVRI